MYNQMSPNIAAVKILREAEEKIDDALKKIFLATADIELNKFMILLLEDLMTFLASSFEDICSILGIKGAFF